MEGLPKSDSIIKQDLWSLADDNCVSEAKNQKIQYFADVQIMVLRFQPEAQYCHAYFMLFMKEIPYKAT